MDTKTKAETVLGVGIISYNTADLLRQCLQSLIETNHVPHEHIVVVDSCSTDTTHEMMHKEYPSITLHILKENKGYAYAVNVAASLLDFLSICCLSMQILVFCRTVFDCLFIVHKRYRTEVYGGCSNSITIILGSAAMVLSLR